VGPEQITRPLIEHYLAWVTARPTGEMAARASARPGRGAPTADPRRPYAGSQVGSQRRQV
jgi:hypothetical protein